MSNMIQVRQGTAAYWAAEDPVLGAGEPGWETDTRLLKIGDGVTAWTSLPPYAPGGGGGTAPIVYRDTLGAPFTSTVASIWTAVAGLTFALTPAADGVLVLASRVRALTTAAASVYMRAKIAPAPLAGNQYITASGESATANRRATYPLLGAWALDGGTAYTVTVEFYQAAAGTVTVDATTEDTELVGVFHTT